ncbi:MAG: acylphosphatase [Lachnospiraceae bacterium]|nr:acylphosphatase [Lachnospiraceae bacterium]
MPSDSAEEKRQARWRICFAGKVQHVGFRYTAYYLAKELYLTGWVDNRPDGTVLMEVQGAVSRIRKMLVKLKSYPHLHIEKTEIAEIELKPHERGFSVRGYSD